MHGSIFAAARSSRGRRALAAGQTAVLLFGVWLALSGLRDWALGLGFAVLGAVLAARYGLVQEPHPWRPLRVLGFFLFFLRESLLGAMDVARRALAPSLPLAPDFVRHPMRLPGGPARTLMVSVVSLLPGTLSADLEEDGATLLVHVLARESAASVSRLEARIAWLFDLDSSP
jgi:multicomponent Na+:H+ antiporter subunit E